MFIGTHSVLVYTVAVDMFDFDFEALKDFTNLNRWSVFYISADISKKGETTGRTRIRHSAEKAYDIMFDLVSHMERYAVDNEKIGNKVLKVM